uniref:Uncharacterized protein n=1 Tax=Strongyloides venezuelensis TaxID=75913 RepID=A0A0K0FP18_STRVS
MEETSGEPLNVRPRRQRREAVKTENEDIKQKCEEQLKQKKAGGHVDENFLKTCESEQNRESTVKGISGTASTEGQSTFLSYGLMLFISMLLVVSVGGAYTWYYLSKRKKSKGKQKNSGSIENSTSNTVSENPYNSSTLQQDRNKIKKLRLKNRKNIPNNNTSGTGTDMSNSNVSADKMNQSKVDINKTNESDINKKVNGFDKTVQSTNEVSGMNKTVNWSVI